MSPDSTAAAHLFRFRTHRTENIGNMYLLAFSEGLNLTELTSRVNYNQMSPVNLLWRFKPTEQPSKVDFVLQYSNNAKFQKVRRRTSAYETILSISRAEQNTDNKDVFIGRKAKPSLMTIYSFYSLDLSSSSLTSDCDIRDRKEDIFCVI
ncbi:uncharacterized protein RSE6_09582 [Rhynchosporium secalis]|uniref:Uncharacterized protein n=1 Tax=Rhynchosporium secalis TaxID=38038 RepID=A0A1E1MIC5_RHYSE|nr:uncharacterized protein RSE6_09582 [Rhynchosporium secalis]